MDGQCLDRVRAAAGEEPAGRRQRRGDPPAVEPQDDHQQPNHRASRNGVPGCLRRTPCLSRIPRNSGLRPGRRDRHRRLPGFATLDVPADREPISRRNAPSRSSPRAALLAPADAGSARTTTSDPAGRVTNRDRMRCRNRRATRCRTTDPPTVRPTTNPTFGPSSEVTVGLTDGSGSVTPARARWTTTEPRAARRPRCTPVAKSSRRVSRAAAGSNARYPAGEDQADNSMRPLRRRAARIARPARVRMRNRNPWVLARRRLFGWNVRLPLLTAVVLPVLWCASTWARARKNARRWAGDGPSLGGRGPSRQNQRLASLSGRHAVTSMVLAYRGFLWQHPRLVSLRRPNLLEAARQAGTSGRRGERRSPLSTAVDNSVDRLRS